jgi:hypothetical protein
MTEGFFGSLFSDLDADIMVRLGSSPLQDVVSTPSAHYLFSPPA